MFFSLKHLSVSRRLIRSGRDRMSEGMREGAQVRTGKGLYNISIKFQQLEDKETTKRFLF